MLLMNNRRTIYINIAFFAVLIVGYLFVTFYWNAQPTAQVVSFESAGLERPLTPLVAGGKSLSIKDYRGAPLLLHFWASWCEPCTHDEKPLHDLFEAVGGRGAQFVSVASEDQVKSIERTGKLKAYPGDNYIDASGDLARAFSVKAYPYTILIDREGRAIFHGDGPLTDSDIARLKEELGHGASAPSLPQFQYADSSGRQLSSEALAGKVWLADFIFTSCGDTCPMISEKLRAVQEEFGGNPDFRIVSFSVDPQHDTPEALREFGRQHGANAAVWSFLRPPYESLKTLMVQGFKLGTMENPLFHTAKIVLVNKGNVVESYFDGDDPNAVANLTQKLRSLLRPVALTAN